MDIEKTYLKMNEKITPDISLIENTVEKTQAKKLVRFHAVKKAALIAAVILIVSAVGTPVLARNVTPFYNALYEISPQTANFFAPVSESCTDNGIKMEVIAAYIHGSNAEIYVSMQDLEENRIDASTDLFDSYYINCPFDCTGHCEFVSYDDNTKTATFLIKISSMSDNENISLEGKRIKFSVKKFLSGHIEAEGIKITSNAENTETMAVSLHDENSEYRLTGGDIKNTDTLDIFVPGKTDAVLPEEYKQSITAIGFADGRLHIQLATSDALTFDSHGFVYLRDSKGNIIEPETSCSFTKNMNKKDRVDYTEFVFDIDENEFDSYEICADLFSNTSLTEGNWKVSFNLSDFIK